MAWAWCFVDRQSTTIGLGMTSWFLRQSPSDPRLDEIQAKVMCCSGRNVTKLKFNHQDRLIRNYGWYLTKNELPPSSRLLRQARGYSGAILTPTRQGARRNLKIVSAESSYLWWWFCRVLAGPNHLSCRYRQFFGLRFYHWRYRPIMQSPTFLH